MILDNLKKWFTDNYDKDPTSKVSKILSFVAEELEEIKTVYLTVEQYEDLDNAEGSILDLYGANILQFRGQSNDEVYRALIRSKVARNRSTGDYNSLIEILALLLDITYDKIKIEEGTDPLYQTVSVTELPFDALNALGLTVSQFGQVLSKIIAAGVGLESVVFVGTFEYGDVLESGSSIGYADVAMTTGGTLGAVFQPEDDPELPI